MGYPNGSLGDYVNVSNSTVITDAAYARMPVLLRQFYRPKTPTTVKVATVTPINTVLPPRLTPTPVPTSAPLISTTTASAANVVAPIVASAGGPAAAAAAVVPAITNALTQPPTEKVRVTGGNNFLAPILKQIQDLLPASAPAADTSASAPAAPTTTATVYNPDGSPANQASVASGPDLLSTVKKLPPVALAAAAIGAYVLFGRK